MAVAGAGRAEAIRQNRAADLQGKLRPLPRGQRRRLEKRVSRIRWSGDKSVEQLVEVHRQDHARRRSRAPSPATTPRRSRPSSSRRFTRRPPGHECPGPDRAVAADRSAISQRRRRPGRHVSVAPPTGATSAALRGEYFNARNFQNNKRLIDRTDPQVKFDFAHGRARPRHVRPDPVLHPLARDRCWHRKRAITSSSSGPIRPSDFGSTTCKKPLIDAWVKSGNDTEFRGSIFLIAGRAYPLRLEFSKAKQGVDDTKDGKKKPPPKPASITLAWKQPRQVDRADPEPVSWRRPDFRNRSSSRRRSRRTTAATAGKRRRRSPRRGTRRPPTARSRRPATSSPIWTNSAGTRGRGSRIASAKVARAFAGGSSNAHFAGR